MFNILLIVLNKNLKEKKVSDDKYRTSNGTKCLNQIARNVSFQSVVCRFYYIIYNTLHNITIKKKYVDM